MRVLGIDLSLTNTGLAVLENDELIEYKSIKTKPSERDPSRMDRIMVATVALANTCEMLGLERGVFGPHSDSRVHGIGALVRWALWKECFVEGDDLIILSPSTVKKFATGRGNASKPEMLAAAQARYNIPADHNIADAIHIARLVASSS